MKNFVDSTINLEGYDLSFLGPVRGPVQPTAFDLERFFPGRLYWKWAVVERYLAHEQKLAELCAAGWERIDHKARPQTLFRITSQLNLVLAFIPPGRGTKLDRQEIVFWVRRQDLLHAENVPVVLVYEENPKTNVLVDPIPGMHAIIFENDAVYRYELSQLKESGLELVQCIAEGIGSACENALGHFALAQTAACRLSEMYWDLHQQSVVKPVRLPHSLMDIAPAFRHANLYENQGSLIPATDALEAAMMAMTDAHNGAKGWGNRDQVPLYLHERATSTTAVTLLPDRENAMAERLWERIMTYSDNDGDVLLAMFAQVVAAGPDEQGGTWITVQAILDYRGILSKRHETEPGVYRNAGHRPEDMRQIADCVGRLRDMHVSVQSWHEPKRLGGRRRKVLRESYLVLISDFLIQAEEDQTKKEDPLQIAWYYRLGSCLDMPLRKNAKVAWLLQQALRYDPYHEKWEKRLARYFMFQLRINRSFGGTVIQRSIREILEESGLISSIDFTNPARTRVRFEKAMRTLSHHGHISDWSEEAYMTAMKQRPIRGWLDLWLAHLLEITAAPLLGELAQDMLDHVQTQHQITAPKKRRIRKKEDKPEP